jgi:hypothetical protein
VTFDAQHRTDDRRKGTTYFVRDLRFSGRNGRRLPSVAASVRVFAPAIAASYTPHTDVLTSGIGNSSTVLRHSSRMIATTDDASFACPHEEEAQ